MEVRSVIVDANSVGQRIDNYLVKLLKGVPKSRIYRAVRKGEVRVNKRRVKVDYRLKEGDEVRVPPIRVASPQAISPPNPKQVEILKNCVLYEDDEVMIFNKPVGVAVHGGSGIRMGLVESLRTLYPSGGFLELVHRLDRDTSGCLLLAKKRAILVELHHLLVEQKVTKQYLALVKGNWPEDLKEVSAPLKKNALRSGERMVVVSDQGKSAVTHFRPIQKFKEATLVEAKPLTGRTHQIRVHAAHVGHPIAGDEKYGDVVFNKEMRKKEIKRLFLHSAGIYCELSNGHKIGICAPLDIGLQKVLASLC